MNSNETNKLITLPSFENQMKEKIGVRQDSNDFYHN
jgi:hypothetical protein